MEKKKERRNCLQIAKLIFLSHATSRLVKLSLDSAGTFLAGNGVVIVTMDVVHGSIDRLP